MNDYMTIKTIEAKRQDAARRQRNADYLDEIRAAAPSLRQRIHQWWARLLPSPTTDTLAQRAARLQAPARVTTTECSRTGSGA